MNQELIAKRLNGELPRIQIGDDTYIVDWRFRELRCQDDPSRVIDISRMDTSREGNEYIALYDPVSKQVLYNPPEKAFHKDMQVLSIPYELKLDPVAVARQYGLQDTELLQQFPLQERLQAKLEKVEDFQQRNLRSTQQQQPKKEQQQKARKRKGRRM